MDEEADEFDAKLEKRRKRRAAMKPKPLLKLGRLVASLLHSCACPARTRGTVEEELAKAAAHKKPDNKQLSSACLSRMGDHQTIVS